MFGGGGFGDGGGGFSTGSFSSPGPGGDRQKKMRSQNIAPLTIANINNLSHDGQAFHLDNVEIGQVTIVGIVTNVDKSQTSVTYQIDDTTATPVTVKHWYSVEEGEEGEEDQQAIFNEGAYVRVYAQVRSFQNQTTLSALKMYGLEDMNELTTHILECIKFQMSLKKKKSAKAKSANAGGSGFMSNSESSSSMNMGIDKVQSQVFELIKNCQLAEGLSLDSIKSQLKGLNSNQIRNSLEFLSNEGHIYSTIDEDHFKSTG